MNLALRPHNREHGATLIVTLIMLLMMTLFAIAAVNLSGANLRVIGNMQARTAAEAAAMWAIEDTLSSINWFTTNAGTVRNVVAPNGLTAQVQSRTCKHREADDGNSQRAPGLPEQTVWEFKVEVTDPLTNAKAGMWQGAKIRMLYGQCV